MGGLRWTLERFLERAKEIHGPKFDYSFISEKHINGRESKVPIKCNQCNCSWSPSINNHINRQSGCPDCSGNVVWTLGRFLRRAKEIHGDQFDYSCIVDGDIVNHESRINIKCITCSYQWSPSIDNHISARSGCPNCSGNAQWTLCRFLVCAEKVHGNRFDYSLITGIHNMDSGSKVPIICKTCKYKWSPMINNHINKRSGCPSCSNKARWTIERFLSRAIRVHHDLYDYSLITSDDITSKESRILIICKTCKYKWSPTLHSHINNKTGCPVCKSSYGEKECKYILDECNLEYDREVILPELPNSRYDFAFVHEDHLYFLEFDGIQHFENVPHFHKSNDEFLIRQENDRVKTSIALKRGSTIIRIDYTQVNNIYEHICLAIERGENLYLSTPEMYKYITNFID